MKRFAVSRDCFSTRRSISVIGLLTFQNVKRCKTQNDIVTSLVYKKLCLNKSIRFQLFFWPFSLWILIILILFRRITPFYIHTFRYKNLLRNSIEIYFHFTWSFRSILKTLIDYMLLYLIDTNWVFHVKIVSLASTSFRHSWKKSALRSIRLIFNVFVDLFCIKVVKLEASGWAATSVAALSHR